MFKRFYPDYKFAKISDIPDSFFIQRGIRFAVLDIDNTLVSYTSPLPDDNARAFLNRLKALGIRYVFVSNNHKDRVKLFCEFVGSGDYIYKANKPFVRKIKQAMKRMGAKAEDTVLIGDQVFTDIYAGKRAKLLSVMVDPIDAKETPFFGIKRKLEKVVLKNYKQAVLEE